MSGYRSPTGFAAAAGPSIPLGARTDCDPDRRHLAYARENDWLLFTFDDDFLSLVDGEGLDHAGVLYVDQTGRDIGDVVKAVDEHLQRRSEDDRTVRHL